MSIQAKLFIDDLEMNILALQYTFDKSIDSSGRPTTNTRLKGLHAVIEARKENNLMDWSIHPNQMKQVEVQYVPRIFGAKTRKLLFVDAHCIKYQTQFMADGVTPLTETIFLTCGGLKDSDSSEEYSAYWRVTFPDTAASTEIIEETPEIVSCGYEDLNGNPIPDHKVMVNDNILFALNTSNAVGKEITINLASNTKNFEYNGSVLVDDTLKITITSDAMKLALKVINQQ